MEVEEYEVENVFGTTGKKFKVWKLPQIFVVKAVVHKGFGFSSPLLMFYKDPQGKAHWIKDYELVKRLEKLLRDDNGKNNTRTASN